MLAQIPVLRQIPVLVPKLVLPTTTIPPGSADPLETGRPPGAAAGRQSHPAGSHHAPCNTQAALPANPPLTQNADHALLDGIGPHPVLTVTEKSFEIQSIVLNARNADP